MAPREQLAATPSLACDGHRLKHPSRQTRRVQARKAQAAETSDLARRPESRHRGDLLCLLRRGLYAYVLNRQVGMQSAKQVGMHPAKAL